MFRIIAICDNCGKERPVHGALSIRGAANKIEDDWTHVNELLLCNDCSLALGCLIPCPGEAHDNPNIDNCAVCAPMWGVIRPDKLPDFTQEDLYRARREVINMRRAERSI